MPPLLSLIVSVSLSKQALYVWRKRQCVSHSVQYDFMDAYFASNLHMTQSEITFENGDGVDFNSHILVEKSMDLNDQKTRLFRSDSVKYKTIHE